MRVDVMKFSRLGLCVYSMECGRCLNLTFYDISLICYTGVGPLSLFKLLLIKKIIPKCQECVHEKTRQNQAGGDNAQITDFAQTWHKC